MAKKVRLPIRSLGSEVEDPSVEALSGWVAGHRGLQADLLTYKLDESLRVQEGVDSPAAGGRFYGVRLAASIAGIREGALIEEPGILPEPVVEDADYIASNRKGIWCSFPSPRSWGVRDDYIHDEEEFLVLICRCALALARTMRDRGVKGHIIHTDSLQEDEIEALAGPKILLYAEEPDYEGLSMLLEHQTHLAIPSTRVSIALGLLDEFEITHLTIVDPTPESVTDVLGHFDPDTLSAGGYCHHRCSGYWSNLRDSVSFKR